MAEKPAAVQVGNSQPRIDALQRCLAILVTDQTGPISGGIQKDGAKLHREVQVRATTFLAQRPEPIKGSTYCNPDHR
jgi:hypothetical protein